MNPTFPPDAFTTPPGPQPAISKAALATGLFGGGIAWTGHFMLSWAIAEFGCLSGWGQTMFLGVTQLAWLLLGISVVAAGGALGSTVLAHRSGQRLERITSEGTLDSVRSVELSLARTGRWMSGLFTFIILVEALPIFFFLQRC